MWPRSVVSRRGLPISLVLISPSAAATQHSEDASSGRHRGVRGDIFGCVPTRISGWLAPTWFNVDRPLGPRSSASSAHRARSSSEVCPPVTVGFRVVEVGIASSVQDAGRAGYSHLGLGRSGIADQASAASLNRSVGNAETTPVLETAGGLVVECLSRSTVAASGWTAPRVVAVGERILIDHAPGEQWGYLALAAGLRGVPVLGSLSADTMAAITAVSVSTGARLKIGEARDRSLLISSLYRHNETS